MRLSLLIVALFAVLALAAARKRPATKRRARTCGATSKSSMAAHRSVASNKKLFYGAANGNIGVTIYGHGTHTIKVYLNGDWLASSDTCHQSVSAGAHVWQGDVIAVEAGSTNPEYSFSITVTSPDGETMYMTTGQVGWKAVPSSQAGTDWKLPGYDDSQWPDAVVSPTGPACEIDSHITESGAQYMWAADTAQGTIAARYVVGAIGKDCSCTKGRPGCPDDGICRACVFAENSGTRDCYSDWNEDECERYGVVDNGEYFWCGEDTE